MLPEPMIATRSGRRSGLMPRSGLRARRIAPGKRHPPEAVEPEGLEERAAGARW